MKRGFTLVELLIVMVVMGILASLALIKTNDLRNAATATQVSQEMRAVQIAAFNYYISVAKGEPFRPRFLEMAGLSFGVAAFSFVIGYLIRLWLGVDI